MKTFDEEIFDRLSEELGMTEDWKEAYFPDPTNTKFGINMEKLSSEDIEQVGSILGDYAYDADEYSQSVCYDGCIYLANILKAADFIRSKIRVETPIEQRN